MTWERRRTFRIDAEDIPVARLTDIVTSKAATVARRIDCLSRRTLRAIRQMQKHDESR